MMHSRVHEKALSTAGRQQIWNTAIPGNKERFSYFDMQEKNCFFGGIEMQSVGKSSRRYIQIQ